MGWMATLGIVLSTAEQMPENAGQHSTDVLSILFAIDMGQ